MKTMTIRIGALAGPILAPPRAGWALFASALPAAMLFLASFTFLLGGHANGDEGAAQQPGIWLRVPRSLPVVGERQELTAFIRYKTEEALEARVVFSVAEGERAGQRPLAEKQVMLLPGAQPSGSLWEIGTPITSYGHGPGANFGGLTPSKALELAEGGFNMVWAQHFSELDNAHAQGLRAMYYGGGYTEDPTVLDDSVRTHGLNVNIDNVKDHPAMYAYYMADEPSATEFEDYGRLAAHIRERDPNHMIYINLLPTYASDVALLGPGAGPGSTAEAYREYLRQYVYHVKPDMISYDHYHFRDGHDGSEYFLNLALVREAALNAGIPFINYVQAVSLAPSGWRVPTPNEGRFLAYTTLAYGGQGLTQFTYYSYSDFEGGVVDLSDGTLTPLGEALRDEINPEFVAVAEQVQPLRSIGAYHVGTQPEGTELLPNDSPFDVLSPTTDILVGLFGGPDAQLAEATYALVVNLDYTNPKSARVSGPGELSVFDASTGVWSPMGSDTVLLSLLPGGGKLVGFQSQPPTPSTEFTWGSTEAVVKAEWTPGAAGDHALSARLEVRAGDGWEQAGQASQAVVATRRRLHFHHWNTRPDLVFITEGMVSDRRADLEDPVGYWVDRGVVAQSWAGGVYAWERTLPDAKPPARIKAVANNWREDLAQSPRRGMVIDELGNGSESQHLGEAIALTRQMEPEAYIAVYTTTVVKRVGMLKGMIKGLKAADRVLVESYPWGPSLDSIQERDTVQYEGHRRRYETTVYAGIGEKSLLTLAIGGPVTSWGAQNGITTPQELRRQLHWVRYDYPEMAGISFYGGAPHLNLDEQLRAFYADPVLRAAQGENGVVRVANIGGDHAPATRIKLAAENARAREYEVEVPALKVDEEFAFGVIPENNGRAMQIVEIAAGDEPPAGLEKQLLPVTEYRPGLYVLGPPMLWSWEPAEFRPGAEDAWPEPGLTAATVRNLLSRPPSAEEAAEEGQGDKKEDGTPPSLYYDIEETGGRSFLLTFDLLTSRVPDHGGGSIEVRLGEQDGTSSLRLQIIGLKDPVGGHAYSQILLTNKQEAMEEEPDYVREYMAVEIVPDTLYQYRVHYDSSGYVRVAIHGEGGEKLWDTGRVLTYGELAFDRMSFAAHGPRNRAGDALRIPGVKVEWERENEAIMLRGMRSSAEEIQGRLRGFDLNIYER